MSKLCKPTLQEAGSQRPTDCKQLPQAQGTVSFVSWTLFTYFSRCWACHISGLTARVCTNVPKLQRREVTSEASLCSILVCCVTSQNITYRVATQATKIRKVRFLLFVKFLKTDKAECWSRSAHSHCWWQFKFILLSRGQIISVKILGARNTLA